MKEIRVRLRILEHATICTEITFVEVGSALLGYSYLHGVEAVISNIARTQMDAIGEAATSIADCLSREVCCIYSAPAIRRQLQ